MVRKHFDCCVRRKLTAVAAAGFCTFRRVVLHVCRKFSRDPLDREGCTVKEYIQEVERKSGPEAGCFSAAPRGRFFPREVAWQRLES